jgi:hypothetical protein
MDGTRHCLHTREQLDAINRFLNQAHPARPLPKLENLLPPEGSQTEARRTCHNAQMNEIPPPEPFCRHACPESLSPGSVDLKRSAKACAIAGEALSSLVIGPFDLRSPFS